MDDKTKYVLTGGDHLKVKDTVAKIDGLSVGPGLTLAKTPKGISIGLIPRSTPKASDGKPAKLPSGQYIGQVYQTVAQNVSGWEFVQAHTLPE